MSIYTHIRIHHIRIHRSITYAHTVVAKPLQIRVGEDSPEIHILVTDSLRHSSELLC
jgi:hypothetical protein